MKRISSLAVILLLGIAPGAAVAQDPAGFTATFPESLESRVFPLASMIKSVPGWMTSLRNDPALAALARDRAARVPAENCAPAPACLADAWRWTPADIALVDGRLQALVRRPDMARELVTRQLRPSRRFERHAGLGDAQMLSAAWNEMSAAINRVIDVYAKGQAPRYPVIDAIIFDPAKPEFANVLKTHGVATAALGGPDDTFLDPALRYATGLLMMNERTEAASFRPLLGGPNAEAAQAVSATRWHEYPHPALLVFGHGPEDPQSRTGVMGHIRLRIAAEMFRRGLAPFIVVSGGNVHPNRTPFNEAVEMKRLLIEQHAIPANRILMEPHARHTTTNLRNCARLLLAAGFPADRPSLIVSDHLTIQYIAGSELAARNVREMGIQPERVSRGIDRFTALFTPEPAAFHVEATDPLDP